MNLDGTKITLRNKKFTIRRMSLRDLVSLGKVLTDAARAGFLKTEDMNSVSDMSTGFSVITQIPEMYDDVMELLASLIEGEGKEELVSTMRIEEFADILDVISKQEDFSSFFQKMGVVKTRLLPPRN